MWIMSDLVFGKEGWIMESIQMKKLIHVLTKMYKYFSASCGAQADIVFMLDGSGSVGNTNFQLLLGFVNSMVKVSYFNEFENTQYKK